jgi:hypothetical protein
MEYDLQYDEAPLVYSDFVKSSFNVSEKGEYDCMVAYLDNKYIKYFDVHVFYSRKDGFSVPIKINTNEVDEDDDTIIEFAVATGKLDRDDADNVSYVEEVELYDYIGMGGK